MNKLNRSIKIIKVIAAGIWFAFLLPFRLIKYGWILISWLYQYIKANLSKRLRFSITFKTTSMYALIFTIVLVVLSLTLTVGYGAFLFFSARISLENEARLIANELKQDDKLPEERIRDYANIKSISITLFDQGGDILYTVNSLETGPTTSNGDMIHVNSGPGRGPNVWIDSSYQFLNLRYYPISGGRIFYVQLSKSIQHEKLYLILLLVFLVVFSVFAILTTSSIGYWNGRKMLKPIDKMTRTARLISASDLHRRLDVVRSHDELKDLADTFNQMLDRIESSYEQQKRFVSDASHELRTPISVIQGYANLLKRWGKNDQAVLEEAVNAIASETAHMKDLVEKLLFLARAEQASQAVDKSLFSLDELIREVLHEMSIVDTDHTITSDINEAAILHADRQLIKQALRIFVDNSIKYTPPSGTIKINNSTRGRMTVITIEDTGTGIAAEEIPYIFDRFYRCDESRTRQTGGTGLGLAIAKWIIEKHNGTINVESALGQGTKVTVILPFA